MANGTIDQSLIDEQFLQCSICVDRFVEPKVLPKCGHIFCRTCLDGVLRANGDEMLICPICRTDNTGSVRGGDIDRLPDSHLAKSLIELVNTPTLHKSKSGPREQTTSSETTASGGTRTPSSRRKLQLPAIFHRKRTSTPSTDNSASLHQYMCPVCATDFHDQDSLHSHVEICLSRNAAFLASNALPLALHRPRRDSGPTYACPVCQVECPDEVSLQCHVEMCLRDQEAESDAAGTQYTCPICMLNFSDETILQVHVDTCLSDEQYLPVDQTSQLEDSSNESEPTDNAAWAHHRESYLCPTCEGVFGCMEELALHTTHCSSGSHGHHRETPPEESAEAADEVQELGYATAEAGNTVNLGDFELNACPTCQSTFADSACYLSHMTVCIPENTVLLSDDDVTVNLNNPDGQASDQWWYECPNCHQPFDDFETFKSHGSSCTGERLRRRKLCVIL